MSWHYWVLLAAAAFWLLTPILLWWAFLGVINLAGVEKSRGLTPLQYRLGIVFAAASIVLDIWVNVSWGTLVFLQLPNVRRLTLSARMDDLIKFDAGWRKQRALQIVGGLLEPFDATGQHTTYGLYTRG